MKCHPAGLLRHKKDPTYYNVRGGLGSYVFQKQLLTVWNTYFKKSVLWMAV